MIKTSGIVLNSIRYGETSLVVHIFTEHYGVQGYLVPGVRKAKARMHQNLFQPLTIVEMVAYHKEHGGLQRIKEIHCPSPYKNIPVDITKTSVAIFLSELLTNTLRLSDTSPGMFMFVKQAMQFLDESNGRVSDFHLVFMLQLSKYMGFSPRLNYDNRHCFFNLEEGVFQQSPHGKMCLDKELSKLFNDVNITPFGELETLEISSENRRELLYKTIDYFRLHLEGLKEIRSHIVLEGILH